MMYECTDCEHCADFDFGFRVFCLHPELPSDEVCKYYPVGDHDAEHCKGFSEDEPHRFGKSALNQAEQYSKAKYGDVTYEGIREWCLAHYKEGKKK